MNIGQMKAVKYGSHYGDIANPRTDSARAVTGKRCHRMVPLTKMVATRKRKYQIGWDQLLNGANAMLLGC